MVPFNLGSYKFDLPQDYGELTLKQFYAIRKSNGDLLDLFSILSGLDRSIWEEAKDLDIDAKLSPYLEWMNEKFNPDLYIKPVKLRVNGEYYDVPKDIKLKTFGQKLALQNEVERVGKDGGTDVDVFPFALSLYFQPTYFNNKYDAAQVDELLPLIMECKIEEAYPIASFFLNNYLKSLQSRKRNFLMILHRKKLERALAGSESSKSLEQYTPFQRVLIRITKKFSKWITTRYSSRSGMKGSIQNTKGALTK
jgi:hypothetical protein